MICMQSIFSDIHYLPQGLLVDEDIPQLNYPRERLTLRLAGVTDGRADWAARVASSLSHHYYHVWLTWCHMTAQGGAIFLDHLLDTRTLISAIHVFPLTGRPDAAQFSALTSQAAQLPAHTLLYW